MFGAQAVYTCGPGRLVSPGVIDLLIDCDETGNWFPSLDIIECVGKFLSLICVTVAA